VAHTGVSQCWYPLHPGFTREGCCTTGPQDLGSHTVCARVTTEFLLYSRRQGNDLMTPRPQFR
jgi:uncharacterized protein